MKFVPPPSYTPVPNLILDEVMPHATPAELKVTLAIARATFGWKIEERLLTNAELCELTGLSRQSVTDGLKAAEKRGYVGKRHAGGNRWLFGLRVKKDDTGQNLGCPDFGHDSPKTRKPQIRKDNSTSGKEREGESVAPLVGKADSGVVREIFDYWRRVTSRNGRTQLTPTRRKKIAARLKDSTPEEIRSAIDGNWASDFHRDKGFTDIELICRSRDKLEEFAAKAPGAASDHKWAAYDAAIENRQEAP